MASKLEHLCSDLLTLADDMRGYSHDLPNRALQVRSVAARVSQVAGESAGQVPREVVALLDEAARSLFEAARMLERGELAARRFVERAVAGGGTAGASADTAGGEAERVAGGAAGVSPDRPTVGGWAMRDSTSSGMCFLENAGKDAALLPWRHQINQDNGWYDVMCHGVTAGGGAVKLGWYDEQISAAEFASRLRTTPGFSEALDAKCGVRLVSCRTGWGEPPVAQQLADALGVPVKAPLHSVGVNPLGGVDTRENWIPGRPAAEFATFYPR